LLGNILDTVLGYSHHDYIREEILEPLGLEHTYSLANEIDNLDDLMSGYHHGTNLMLRKLITVVLVGQ